MKHIPWDEFEKEDVEKFYFNLRRDYVRAKMLENKREKINLSNDFTLSDIRYNSYVQNGIFYEDILINDLQQVIAYIDISNSIYIIKQTTEDGNSCELKRISEADCRKKLINITFEYYQNNFKRTISAWEVLTKNLNKFLYKQITFISSNPQIFSIFQGFPYKESPTLNHEIVKPFLIHTKNSICNGNTECYNYVNSWISYILHNPGKKTNTAIVLIGRQGAGKNLWTNHICKLFGNYSNPNAKMENIVGNFNTGIQDKILIIINEVGSFKQFKESMNNKIKTAITEDRLDINPKHKDSFSNANVANLIFISNEPEPVKIDYDDRRFFVLDVSTEKIKNYENFL